ncbi:hypothetical protein P3T73_12420 [Kiritimatiellota bacterium B12222]|nr:hypothetical protein P3T73_12420 [Kiritimatiellota bacterium B12222]
MKQFSKALLLSSGMVCLSISIGVVWNKTRADRFMNRAILTLSAKPESEDIEKIALPSGEHYFVLLEHACCTGAGFDAVVIRDSNGSIYTAKQNYCGIEGFYGELASKNLLNLSELGTFLRQEGYKLKSEAKPDANASRPTP